MDGTISWTLDYDYDGEMKIDANCIALGCVGRYQVAIDLWQVDTSLVIGL